jgi:hypothetical protein
LWVAPLMSYLNNRKDTFRQFRPHGRRRCQWPWNISGDCCFCSSSYTIHKFALGRYRDYSWCRWRNFILFLVIFYTISDWSIWQ